MQHELIQNSMKRKRKKIHANFLNAQINSKFRTPVIQIIDWPQE